MAKRKESRNLPGRRSENRLKIKARMQQEAIIGGVTGTKPPWSGYS
jgi:ATP-dependent DNA ligase